MQRKTDPNNQAFPAEQKAALAPLLSDDGAQMRTRMLEYSDLMLLYDCAIKIVQTKFDVINAEYKAKFRRNPIHHISSRRKKMASIMRKLQRDGLAFTAENMQTQLHDIAGVRVICAYLDDVYALAQAITQQDDVELIQQKDYISNPKHNGYRSLHLILRVPVFFSGHRKLVEVEVQLRTIAMDYWASLEHQLKYKHELEDPEQIVERLRICAETIASTDTEMLAIRRAIERKTGDAPEEQWETGVYPEFDLSIYH